MIQLGYMRLTKAGRPEAAQRAAMIAAGLDDFSADGPIYVEPMPKRRPRESEPPQPVLAECLRALRPGAVLVLAGLDVLGPTREAMRDALAEVARQGAAVRLMDSGETLTPTPDAVGLVEAIERAAAELHRQRAAVARGAKAARGIKGGRRIRWSDAHYAKARPIYFDLSLTNAEVEARAGIPYRTLFRRFGERGAPRFGRGRPKA